jgi:hypothetical protein
MKKPAGAPAPAAIVALPAEDDVVAEFLPPATRKRSESQFCFAPHCADVFVASVAVFMVVRPCSFVSSASALTCVLTSSCLQLPPI